MFIQLAATHERANSTTFGTRAPGERRQRQEHLFYQRTYARLARVVSFVEEEFFAARRFVSPARPLPEPSANKCVPAVVCSDCLI